MFKQGGSPTLIVPSKMGEKIALALIKSGYEIHRSTFLKRKNEGITLRKSFRGKSRLDDGLGELESRQIHVQIVEPQEGTVHIYAHTEPDIDRPIAHAVSALLDMANFASGARMLRNDLKKSGFKLPLEWNPKTTLKTLEKSARKAAAKVAKWTESKRRGTTASSKAQRQ